MSIRCSHLLLSPYPHHARLVRNVAQWTLWYGRALSNLVYACRKGVLEAAAQLGHVSAEQAGAAETSAKLVDSEGTPVKPSQPSTASSHQLASQPEPDLTSPTYEPAESLPETASGPGPCNSIAVMKEPPYGADGRQHECNELGDALQHTTGAPENLADQAAEVCSLTEGFLVRSESSCRLVPMMGMCF